MQPLRLRSHLIFVLFSFLFLCLRAYGQTDNRSLYFVITKDGEEYIGNVVSENETSVTLRLRNQELKEFNKENVKLTQAVTEDNFFKGKYIKPDPLAHRYIYGSSAISPERNKFYCYSYFLSTASIEYGISDKYAVTLNTSIVGIPVLLNFQANYKLGDRFYLGGTFTAGWLSYIDPEVFFGYGGLRLTRGTKSNNYTFGGGYVSLPFGNVFNSPSNLNLGEFGYLNFSTSRRYTRKITGQAELWVVKNFVLGRSAYQLNFGPRILRRERSAWTIFLCTTAIQEFRGSEWLAFPFLNIKWSRILFTPKPEVQKKMKKD